MSQYYAANLSALSLRDPRLAEELCATSTLGSGLDFTATSRSASSPGGLVVAYGSEAAADFLQAYAQRRNGQRFIFIEKNLNAFHRALQLLDWREYLQDAQTACYVSLAATALGRQLSAMLLNAEVLVAAQHMQVYNSLPALQADGAYYLQAATNLRDLVAQAAQNCVDPEDQYRGLINVCANRAVLAGARPWQVWHEACAGLPGVVISTGPSLDQSLPILRELQDHAVLFAVDSAAPILLRHGIRPHFVACLERVVATEQFFAEADIWTEIPLLALPLVAPRTLATYAGPQFFLGTTGFPSEFLFPEFGAADVGLSASTLALHGLQSLGCARIYLLGQDLAFSQQRSHAQGALPFIQAVGAQQQATIAEDVIGNNGQPLKTMPAYRAIAASLERLCTRGTAAVTNVIAEDYGMKLNLPRLEPSALRSELSQSYPALRAQLATRLQLAPPKLSDQAEPWRRLSHELRELEAAVLDQLRDFSVFYHEHLPSKTSDALAAAYRKGLQGLEAKNNALIRRPVCQNFLQAWLAAAYVHCLQARQAALMEEASLARELKIFRAWQHFLQTFLVWTSRVRQLVERAG